LITQSQLKESLSYEPSTGVFVWRKADHGVRPGMTAGSIGSSRGYTVITLNGRRYPAHRLAWLYVNGSFPKDEIDHINGDRSDNRIANLRESTRSGNTRNRRKFGSTSRHKGVHLLKRGKWQSQICCDGKRLFLGLYDDEDAAGAAYDWNAVQMFGEFAKTNGAVYIL
jgi:hypothetical protein